MIERALLHVVGPRGSGKTMFVEAILCDGAGGLMLAARCVRDDALRRSRETAPRTHPELRRYRQAGASGAALFAFPGTDIGSDAFFMTELMGDYSQGVVLEGDNPLGFVDLGVFVAPAPQAGETLFVRRLRDRAAEQRAKAASLEQRLREPDGVAELFGEVLGDRMAELARMHPSILEETRTRLLAGVAAAKHAPPPPVEYWAIAEPYAGIEHAQLVVVNVRNDAQRDAGERIAADLIRLRKDEGLFNDILGFRGTRIAITAVAANLADPADPGRKKALARVRRALRSRSS